MHTQSNSCMFSSLRNRQPLTLSTRTSTQRPSCCYHSNITGMMQTARLWWFTFTKREMFQDQCLLLVEWTLKNSLNFDLVSKDILSREDFKNRSLPWIRSMHLDFYIRTFFWRHPLLNTPYGGVVGISGVFIQHNIHKLLGRIRDTVSTNSVWP